VPRSASLPGEWINDFGEIASRVDIGSAGAYRAIHSDASATEDTGLSGYFDARFDTNAQQHQFTGNLCAILCDNVCDASIFPTYFGNFSITHINLVAQFLLKDEI
jgi:hypothetical protein